MGGEIVENFAWRLMYSEDRTPDTSSPGERENKGVHCGDEHLGPEVVTEVCVWGGGGGALAVTDGCREVAAEEANAPVAYWVAMCPGVMLCLGPKTGGIGCRL